MKLSFQPLVVISHLNDMKGGPIVLSPLVVKGEHSLLADLKRGENRTHLNIGSTPHCKT